MVRSRRIDAPRAVAALVIAVAGVGLAPSAEALGAVGRPTDAGTSGAYTVPEHSPPHCTANFCVHWVETTSDAPDLTDSDGDGAPDYVEATAAAFEISHLRQHGAGTGGLGWREGKSDGTRGGDDRVDAYIQRLGPNTLGLGPADSSSCAADGCSGFAVIDSQLSADFLKEISAHEYNHILGYTYDRFASRWLTESTATWMSARVHPEVSTWLRFVHRWAAAPDGPLVRGYPYGGAVWNMWLDRRYGPDIIRNVWEQTPGDPDGNDRTQEAYDAAVRARGGRGFEDELTRFSAALPEWRLSASGFPHSPAYADVKRAGALTPGGGAAEVALPGTAFALFDVAPTRAASLRLEARLPETAGAIALVGRDGDPVSGTATTAFQSLPAGGRGEVVLDAPSRFERITAVLVNARSGPDRAPTATASLTQTNEPVGADPQSRPDQVRTIDRTADRTAPRVAAKVRRRVALRSFLRNGVAFRVHSSEAGRLAAQLTVDRRRARKLGLVRRNGVAVVARVERRLRSAGPRRLVIKPSRRMSRRVSRLGRLPLTLRVRVTDTAGNTGNARRRLAAVSGRGR